MVKVSIVVPVYNVENYLSRSIESIQSQTYKDWEMLLINDGSTDLSGDICDSYATKDKRIRVFHQENKGSGMARQKGIDSSIGDYIVFVDPDDYLGSKSLSHNISIIEEYKPQLIVNGYHKISKSGNSKEEIKTEIPVLEGFYHQEDFRNKYNQMINDRDLWNKVYKRKFIQENNIKFTSLPVGQDAEFNYQIYTYLENIYIDKEPFYYYDATRENSAAKRYHENRLDYELKIINRQENMFREWGMQENYQSVINNSLLNSLVLMIVNFLGGNNNLGSKEKVQLLKQSFERKEFTSLRKDTKMSEVDNNLKRLVLFLLKAKQYRLLVFLINIYTKI